MADREPSGGLFGSVRRVADTCLSSVHNRVELFAVELQEEKLRLIRLLLWTGAALFASFLAVTVMTIAIVLVVPPENRSVVVIGFAVFYAIVSIVLSLKLRSDIRNAPPPLAETTAELKKDLECLRSKE
jgi:uncharacterized membrane protein YqjE